MTHIYLELVPAFSWMMAYSLILNYDLRGPTPPEFMGGRGLMDMFHPMTHQLTPLKGGGGVDISGDVIV